MWKIFVKKRGKVLVSVGKYLEVLFLKICIDGNVVLRRSRSRSMGSDGDYEESEDYEDEEGKPNGYMAFLPLA